MGINLNKLEKVSEGETPFLGVVGELREGLKRKAKNSGGSLIVIKDERFYGGTLVDKQSYEYEIYKTRD